MLQGVGQLLHRIRWFNLAVVTITPSLGVYGCLTTPLTMKTLIWSVFYYVISTLGITAGYHRLWSHRSYVASVPLQWFLVLAGASAVQGSCHWWARGHRSHHRYTDSELDPYNAKEGLLWSHIGWMLLKPTIKPGHADIRDLQKNPIVQWQHRWYFPLVVVFGYFLPPFISGYFWNDWWGGFYYAGLIRMTIVHHSVFCVNSLAHYFGDTPYDDKLTPRDHFFAAILTMGEGYHNFHHQFPMDYRNAFRWYQYDPTKWFIALCAHSGIASHLQRFPENEIRKGALTMNLKKLKAEQDGLKWPFDSKTLPVVTWETFKDQSMSHPLILVSGFIHDVSSFFDKHPGGRTLLQDCFGKDATSSFCGGIYNHSNAAYNLMAMMRIAVLEGGIEHVEVCSPVENLRIVESRMVQL